MDPEEFEDGPGTIEPFDGLPCYQPDTLPPAITYTDELVRAYGDAQYGLGRLATLLRDADADSLLLAPIMVREAAMSSQIEGADVSVSDIILHDVEPSAPRFDAGSRDVQEAYNYVDAIREGFDRLTAGETLTVRLIRDLHETLCRDVPGVGGSPGQLREIPVFIGSLVGSAESARFVPANPETVEPLLKRLLEYCTDGSYPPLIDVAITHYQFETIHPFRDRNGRVGRLLMMLQLYDAGLLPEPYLYLSAYFNRHREQYLDYLLEVSRDGAWEQWITFVLEAIAEQADDAYARTIELQSLRTTYRELFPDSPVVRHVIDYVFDEPYFTLERAVEATGRSRTAVDDAVAALQAEGLVGETPGSDRYRVFEATAVLDVVESP